MIPLLQRFLLLLAGATDSQLRTMVEYLKRENQIFRARIPKRNRTFTRWLGQERQTRKAVRQRGRPPTPQEIRDLIVRLASENG